MVGSAFAELAAEKGYDVFSLKSRSQIDLTNPGEIMAIMKYSRPDYCLHFAADVYGVGGNLKYPGRVFFNNTVMNTFIVEAAREFSVKKIVAMGSAAMYSDEVPLPMNEDFVMSGEPHSSEYGYAYSKRAMLAQLKAYRDQFGVDYGFVVATNMYGPRDRFDPLYGHVIPSLLKKFFDAETSGGVVSIWGDGSPTRDFLYSKDAALGILNILESGSGVFNLATGCSNSIKSLVEIISDYFPGVGFDWDVSKPLGQLKRSYDVSRLAALGFSPKYSLREGIGETVSWMRENIETIRL